MENETENQFAKYVSAEFNFLKGEFDFQIVQDHPYRFIASKVNCQVIMEFEKGHFFCWIENHTNDNQKPIYRGINVILIAICKGYQPSNQPVFFSNDERLLNEIKEYSALLIKYCRDFLQGNFLEWPEIEKNLENQYKDIEKEKKFKGKLSFQLQIREKANEAWISKEYQEVVCNYLKILEILTPQEKKRLEYAKKKIPNGIFNKL